MDIKEFAKSITQKPVVFTVSEDARRLMAELTQYEPSHTEDAPDAPLYALKGLRHTTK